MVNNDTDTDWINEALCSQLVQRGEENYDLWFEELDTKSRNHAKSICAACPVQPECLDRACSIQTNSGIWGGVEFFTTNSDEK